MALIDISYGGYKVQISDTEAGIQFRYLHEFERSEGADPHLLCHFFIGSNRAEPLFAYGYGNAKKVIDTQADERGADAKRRFAHSTYNDALPGWLKRRLRTESPYKRAKVA